VAHLNKGQLLSAMYRVGGSIGIVGQARISFVLGKDPDDDSRRVLAFLKGNLSAPPPSWAFRIDPAQGGLVWETGPVDMKADEVLQSQRPSDSDSEDVEDWLRSYLEDGPVDAKASYSAGRNDGHLPGVIKKAKDKLAISTKKLGFGPAAKWVWSLPTSAVPTIETS